MLSRKGVISVVALWVLVILVALAAAAGRRTAVDIALARHDVGALRSRLAALSGVYFTAELLRKSEAGAVSGGCATLYACGLGETREDELAGYFGPHRYGEAEFSVYFPLVDPDGRSRSVVGVTDEAGRLNLNAAAAVNSPVLRELFIACGVSAEEADVVYHSLVDWVDADDEPSGLTGAEKDYYAALPAGYRAKNGFLESVEELMLVRGMTPELFARVSPLVTVFPMDTSLNINWGQASREVLLALARSSGEDREAADRLVDKLLVYRAGSDGREATEDDRTLDPVVAGSQFVRAPDEEAIWQTMSAGQSYSAGGNFLRARVRGRDIASGVSHEVVALINVQQGTIVSLNGEMP